MAEQKETFILRTEWYEAISELNTDDKATLLDNLFAFHLGNEDGVKLNNVSLKIIWKLIQPNLKRNIESYDKRKITSSVNGKLGGRPSKQEENNLNNLNKPNEKPNNLTLSSEITKKPNESLSVSVIVPVSDIVPESDVVVDNSAQKIQQPTTGAEYEIMSLANCRIIYTTKYQAQWEVICMNNKISKDQLKEVLDEFDKWIGSKESSKIPKDYCEHFARWITKDHAQEFIKKLKTPKNERSKYAHFGY